MEAAALAAAFGGRGRCARAAVVSRLRLPPPQVDWEAYYLSEQEAAAADGVAEAGSSEGAAGGSGADAAAAANDEL